MSTTSYRLNDDLSFCRIDGRSIFLDMRDDRYFRLSGHLERALDAHLEGVELSPDDLARLIARNILTDAPPSSRNMHRAIVGATRSALEQSSPPSPYSIGAAAEVFVVVCRTQLQLQSRRLKEILDHAIAYRSRKADLGRQEYEQRMLNEAHVVLRARKLVPVETCCLLDSLSMVMFLARRHLHADIVFGVSDDPFSAHCWVQSGDLILNDAIGNTRAYSAIRVI